MALSNYSVDVGVLSSTKFKTLVKPQIKCPECRSSSVVLLGYSHYEDRYSCGNCQHYFTEKRPHLQFDQGSRDNYRDPEKYQQVRRQTKKRAKALKTGKDRLSLQ